MNELNILQRIDKPNDEERKRISELRLLSIKKRNNNHLKVENLKTIKNLKQQTVEEQLKHIKNSFS